MDANEYQRAAHGFAQYGENAMCPVLGLAEEAGEVLGKVAKFIRRNDGYEPAPIAFTDRDLGRFDVFNSNDNGDFRAALSRELGDVLWMAAEVATNYGLDLGEIMRENIAKLTDRANRGVIVGERDAR